MGICCGKAVTTVLGTNENSDGVSITHMYARIQREEKGGGGECVC